jgi:hypothetical protein
MALVCCQCGHRYTFERGLRAAMKEPVDDLERTWEPYLVEAAKFDVKNAFVNCPKCGLRHLVLIFPAHRGIKREVV